ncbi:MAG: hypothetical protein RL616_2594, partial [Verrucomicrobiota bacterium]
MIWCTTLAVVATGFILPVAQWPTAERAPVTPTEQSISLRGVDPQGVSDSAIAMASWSGEPIVESLPLAGGTHISNAASS